MKKLLFTAAVFTAAYFTANAQQAEMAQILVHYKFTHVRDTNNRSTPYTENTALYVGKSASVYKSYDAIMESDQFKKQLAEAKANSPDGRIQINRQRRGTGTQYFSFPNEQKFFIKDNLVFNSYLIEDAPPTIDWKISGDTASFGALHCQKATAVFKGRNYIAWFCPDMPVHAGPWKLSGLPGVIVDAQDDKNEVIFKFDGVEKVAAAPAPNPGDSVRPDDGEHIITVGMDDSDTDPALIELPAKAIKTTQKEFSKLETAMHKDPQAFADAMLAQQNANMPGGGPKMSIKIKQGPGPVINNPLELTGK